MSERGKRGPYKPRVKKVAAPKVEGEVQFHFTVGHIKPEQARELWDKIMAVAENQHFTVGGGWAVLDADKDKEV